MLILIAWFLNIEFWEIITGKQLNIVFSGTGMIMILKWYLGEGAGCCCLFRFVLGEDCVVEPELHHD